MSKLCSKFQIPASNTVGGITVAETRRVLQSVMDEQTDVCTDKGKDICPSPLRGRGIKMGECLAVAHGYLPLWSKSQSTYFVHIG